MSLAVAVLKEQATGERRVALDEFFLAYRKTAMQGDEILLRIDVPHPSPTAFFTTYKVSKRRELGLAPLSSFED